MSAPQSSSLPSPYTGGAALLEALQQAGVSHLFANFGSDHPAIVEGLAKARATGAPMPRLITCPNEMVALTAAQGFAQYTGRAQAVLVHVDCGTQSLGGAVHNVAKCRTPVLIIAGASPYTQEGELRGGRNEFIHWLQDVPDQRGIVRGYMKYENELRTGRNIKQMIHRAMQIAHSDPPGPVYLMATREVLEEEIPPAEVDPARWVEIASAPMPKAGTEMLARDLAAARRPVVVTSYLGRNPEAVGKLVKLAERFGVAVLEASPSYLNFPSDHPMYQGTQGNEKSKNPALAEADLVVVIDSDVPWIPLINKPPDNARIYHIDIDPLKERTPLWYIPAAHVYRADSDTALRQLLRQFEDLKDLAVANLEEKRTYYAGLHAEMRREMAAREQPADGVITAEFLTARVREAIDRDTILLNEGITNYTAITSHCGATKPQTRFTAGASSLGWSGGAAIGMKLAAPEKTVVALTGDGSYMFSVPSTVHWMARRYGTPFLQVVYNNRGWRAPKFSMLAVHPEGYASHADRAGEDIGVMFDPPPDYSGIAAAAGGAFARIVKRPEDLDGAIRDALKAVREEKRAAVLDVWLARL
jgi:acetolactate synthase-1/2/3 large subunit